jgi:hypothetical protein
VSGTLVGWQFDAPAGTQIVGYRISRSVTVGKPSADGSAPTYYLTWPRHEPGDIREQCVQPACSSLGRRDRAIPENIILSPAGMAGVTAVHLVAGCGGPVGAKCLGSDTAPPRRRRGRPLRPGSMNMPKRPSSTETDFPSSVSGACDFILILRINSRTTCRRRAIPFETLSAI